MIDLFKSLENKLKQKNISLINEAVILNKGVKTLSKSNPLDCWKQLWNKPLYSYAVAGPSHSDKWVNQFIQIGINDEFQNFIDVNKFKVIKQNNEFVMTGEIGEKIIREKKKRNITASKQRIFAIYSAANMFKKRLQLNENFPFFDITDDINQLETNVIKLLSEFKINNKGTGWGPITVCHFLTDFGAAIKPDIHVCRTLRKMNLFSTKKDLPNHDEVIKINKIVYNLNEKLGHSYDIRYVEKLLMEFSRQKLF